ncbi:hypothetical protein [uncultured Nevskia sp.]|uniref:hypothetical protein n=1 Tax=uncultured Nevskia sp. TaxID=228950 RepID=UPI0025EF667F|nr:hypothetical protein [uncultured Nevskia sp.]
MTASASAENPAPRRDLITAVLICAGIAAGLAVAYKAPNPAEQQLAAVVPTAAAPAEAAAGEPINTTFNLDIAMRLAGTQVPAETESFYFFPMVDEVPEAVDVHELGVKLMQAAQEHDYLGIAGPDPERNRRTLLAALVAHQADDLKTLVLIYLGPDSHRADISAAGQKAGFETRFVTYPEPGEASAKAPL